MHLTTGADRAIFGGERRPRVDVVQEALCPALWEGRHHASPRTIDVQEDLRMLGGCMRIRHWSAFVQSGWSTTVRTDCSDLGNPVYCAGTCGPEGSDCQAQRFSYVQFGNE